MYVENEIEAQNTLKLCYIPLTLRPFQSSWEGLEITDKSTSIQNSLVETVDKARFLANSSAETGAWLQALPSPQLGTHMSNDEFRVSISLRLGLPILQPHKCVCGTKVDKFTRHGLSCSKAAGTRPRHEASNNLILRALKSAEIPSTREPPGCSGPDGKKPDGLSLVPWARGRSLLWDFTCSDTFAPSYVQRSSRELGWVAKEAERKKFIHYDHLKEQFIFVAAETSGVFGKHALKLLKKIGSKITEVTKEKRATSYLFQRISIAIQRGNVASILGTIPPSKNLTELYYL